MLGKQGLRIMSIFSFLGFLKHSSQCDFMESNLRHNPSFVWISICNSKFILRASSRCDNLCWSYNWLSDNSSLTPQYDTKFSLAKLWVSYLVIIFFLYRWCYWNW